MGFFNQPKPKGFRHIPIYFDPDKEALQERIQKKREELGLVGEREKLRPHLQKGFIVENSSFVRSYRAKKNKNGSQEMGYSKGIVVLVLLVIVFYYFYLR